MNFTILSREELGQIYNEHLIFDFPAEEVKPLRSMYHMMDRDCYAPYVIMENNRPVGYALFVTVPGENFILLDYFAVFNEFRNDGIGGRALKYIRDFFAGRVVFIESENPDFQKDPEISGRRLNFYKRNGCTDSKVLTSIFGVHYINLYIADRVYDFDYCKNSITTIYKYMVIDKKQYMENILI